MIRRPPRSTLFPTRRSSDLAQLVDTTHGYQIWSERYDRDVEDVFDIQDEIARRIVDELKLKLTPAEDKADRKSTRLNSSHLVISYAVFCLKKKNTYMISHAI